METEDLCGHLLDILTKFSVHLISNDWVQSVVDSDYTETSPLPDSFTGEHSQTNWPTLLKEAGRQCRQLVLSENAPEDLEGTVNAGTVAGDTGGAGEGVGDERRSVVGGTSSIAETSIATGDEDRVRSFWVALNHAGIPLNKLITLLFNFIYLGQRRGAGLEECESGMRAAALYLSLLSLQGSSAFRLFHPVLYSRVLDTFAAAAALVTSASGRHGNNKDEGGRSAAASDLDDSDLQWPSTEQTGEGGEDHVMEPHQSARLLRVLNVTLRELLLMVERFPLRHGAQTLSDTIDALVELSRTPVVAAGPAGGDGPGSSLVHNAFCALLRICRPLHGSVERAMLQILHSCLPSLLHQPSSLPAVGGSSALSSRATPCSARQLSAVRDRSLQFIEQLVATVSSQTGSSSAIATSCLLVLVQQLCLRVPERAECRQRAAHTLLVLLQLFDTAEGRQSALSWLLRLSRHERVSHRLLVLELVARLLLHRQSRDHDPDPQHQQHERQKLVAQVVVAGCWDVSALIRSRALAVLAECTVAEERSVSAAAAELMTSQHHGDDQPEGDEVFAANESIPAMLRRRARDPKVMVRKSSIQVIENTMKASEKCVTTENLQILMEHCRDPALLVRKQCQSSLVALVDQYPADRRVCEAAIRGLLPQIHDTEERVQERVVQFVEQKILAGVYPWRPSDDVTADEQLPWVLLDLIVKLCYQKYLLKIMQLVYSKQTVSPAVWAAIQSHVGSENNAAAWLCLSTVARFSRVRQPAFAVEYFLQRAHGELQTEELLALQQCLTVVKFSCDHLDEAARASLTSQMTSLVRAAALPTELISAVIDTVAMVTLHGYSDESEYHERLQAWCLPLLESCEEYLSKHLLQLSSPCSAAVERMLVRQMFTLGELAQLVPARVDKRCFLLLQNVIYVDTGGASDGVTSLLCAVTVATLGKLCLQHEQMAKRLMPALGKLLDVSDSEAVKNNIVFTLSDMCVRYATLVDPLMPQFTCCLRDSSVVVRRNSLILLIGLLQEDYLKLKGTLFYRLLQCLTDPEGEIRQLINFYMTERLAKRNPKVFFQHFVESFFLFNDYNSHESYNKMARAERESELFRFSGSENRLRRHYVYKYMLENMADDQRFHTSYRLCQDVLGGVVDGKVNLDSVQGVNLVQDALCVLSSDEIRLQSLRCRPEDDQPDPGDSGAITEVMQAVAKKTLISQVVKRNIVENMVPIVIALKHKLHEMRSPLLRELMVFLREMMKDYRTEIKDILVADPQLAKEIEFDMKRMQDEARADSDADDIRADPAALVAASARSASAQCRLPIQKLLEAALKQSLMPAAGGGPEVRVFNPPDSTPTASVTAGTGVDSSRNAGEIPASIADQGDNRNSRVSVESSRDSSGEREKSGGRDREKNSIEGESVPDKPAVNPSSDAGDDVHLPVAPSKEGENPSSPASTCSDRPREAICEAEAGDRLSGNVPVSPPSVHPHPPSVDMGTPSPPKTPLDRLTSGRGAELPMGDKEEARKGERRGGGDSVAATGIFRQTLLNRAASTPVASAGALNSDVTFSDCDVSVIGAVSNGRRGARYRSVANTQRRRQLQLETVTDQPEDMEQ